MSIKVQIYRIHAGPHRSKWLAARWHVPILRHGCRVSVSAERVWVGDYVLTPQGRRLAVTRIERIPWESGIIDHRDRPPNQPPPKRKVRHEPTK